MLKTLTAKQYGRVKEVQKDVSVHSGSRCYEPVLMYFSLSVTRSNFVFICFMVGEFHYMLVACTRP